MEAQPRSPVTTSHDTRFRVRRSRHLVLYWRRGRLIVHNYATGEKSAADPLLCGLLDYCSEWRTGDEVRRVLHSKNPRLVRKILNGLVARGFLDRAGTPEHPRVRAMRRLDRWNPEAGFFHAATKDVRFWSPLDASRWSRRQAADWPMPPPVKRYPGAAMVDLPKPRRGEFADVLRSRRPWRRFSTKPLELEELSSVLGLSAGVQRWVATAAGEVPLKTSPSGGARHPIECYVVARGVRGLRSGLYHYAADRHALERLGRTIPANRIASYFPSSRYFAKAPVQVFFTAVFERQAWRYPYARAYRAALAEAGHVCQTFCLTAAWLGLAPFCLMGFADSLIEDDLGIDGVSESVLYAAGLGRTPKGAIWAPLPAGTHGKITSRPNLRLRP
jgi:SagB-type dehydrogenase family enzyme